MAEPISAGTMLAITALSSLAQAGGMAAQGQAQGQMSEADRKLRERQFLREMQERDEDQAFGRLQHRDNQARMDRAEVANRPMNNISMLSGLAGLRQGMSRSTPIDVLGFLSGG